VLEHGGRALAGDGEDVPQASLAGVDASGNGLPLRETQLAAVADQAGSSGESSAVSSRTTGRVRSG
jgi:hypothetical protein